MQIMLDKLKSPRLEDFDAPLERFMELSKAAGFKIGQLHLKKTKADSKFLLYGIAWREDVLSQLPM